MENTVKQSWAEGEGFSYLTDAQLAEISPEFWVDALTKLQSSHPDQAEKTLASLGLDMGDSELSETLRSTLEEYISDLKGLGEQPLDTELSFWALAHQEAMAVALVEDPDLQINHIETLLSPDHPLALQEELDSGDPRRFRILGKAYLNLHFRKLGEAGKAELLEQDRRTAAKQAREALASFATLTQIQHRFSQVD